MRDLTRISDKLLIKLLECKFDETMNNMSYVVVDQVRTIHNKPYLEQVKARFIDKYKIFVIVLPVNAGYFTFKLIDIQCDPENEIERPPYENVDGTDYNSYDDALEAGLIKTCTLINIKEE